MRNQWIQASGYLSILLMPALFLAGVLGHRPWLAFGTVVLVFPLTRLLFGAVPAAAAPEWRESVATVLHRLPLLYAPALIACVLVGLHAASARLAADAASWLGLGLSLWMTLLFGTCVAHELIHRHDKRDAVLGHLVAGFCGYPVLGMEHLAHHGRPGDTTRAEVPTSAESMWHFAARRMRLIYVGILGPHAPFWHRGTASPGVLRTRAALVATALTAIAFALIDGWRGACLYVAMSASVSFGVQLITYIQHWGLGDEDIGQRVAYGRGWEDDCQFQAWITLSISLHDRHHLDSRLPFYRSSPSPDSPRLPAGYVVLMFASMVPRVWRRMMRTAYSHWLEHPRDPRSPGRKLTCFGLRRA